MRRWIWHIMCLTAGWGGFEGGQSMGERVSEVAAEDRRDQELAALRAQAAALQDDLAEAKAAGCWHDCERCEAQRISSGVALCDGCYEVLSTARAQVERLERGAAIRPSEQTMLDDLAALLRALGMFDGARPESPHEVMEKAIRQVERLRKALKNLVWSIEVGWRDSDLDEARAALQGGSE